MTVSEYSSNPPSDNLPLREKTPPPSSVVIPSNEHEPSMISPSSTTSLIASPQFRHASISFNPFIDCPVISFPAISLLHTTCPALKIYTRSSPYFHSLRAVYQLYCPTFPLAILRPRTISEIQSAVLFATTHSPPLPLAVRSGGHDGSARGSVEGGIVLDLREMDVLALNKETMTVKVGGGTNAGNLVRFLHEHGLLAAIGECSAVGVTNWAACGGYGFLNGKVGLGVDQIVGAIVVDARGVVRDTRAIGEEGRELLWGIRGAGGNFGVLVEVELKVHKIEKMLGGWLAFKFEEARGVMQGYKALVEHAKEGSLDPWGGAWGIFNMDIGKVLLYMATWADEDVAKGKEFMDQLRALGTPALDTVQETTYKQWLDTCGNIGPVASFQTVQAPYVRELSDPLIDAIMEYAEIMPDDHACMINVHTCHGLGALPDLSSSFAQRGKHLILEFIGATVDKSPEVHDKVKAWCMQTGKGLRAKGLCIDGGYVNFMDEREPVDGCFGGKESWQRLLALKRKYDRENVFANATPKLDPSIKIDEMEVKVEVGGEKKEG